MERRDAIEWLNNLKIAVFNEDLEKLESIAFTQYPHFEDIENTKIAKSLVDKAIDIFMKEQDKISRFFVDYRKNKAYGDGMVTQENRNSWVG